MTQSAVGLTGNRHTSTVGAEDIVGTAVVTGNVGVCVGTSVGT